MMTFFRKLGPKVKSCDFSKTLAILKGPHRLNFSICDVIFNILHFFYGCTLGENEKNHHFCETPIGGFHKKMDVTVFVPPVVILS